MSTGPAFVMVGSDAVPVCEGDACVIPGPELSAESPAR